MLRPAKILLVGTSVATVAFATASAKAQDAGGRIAQFSLEDVFDGRKLNVIDPAKGEASATATAVGNTLETEGAEPSVLQLTRSVRTRAKAEVHGWASSIDVTAASVGNSLESAASGEAFSASTDQAVGVNSEIKARARIKAELSSSGEVTGMAVAVGNDQTTTAEAGSARIRSGQYHYGQGTNARVRADLVDVQGTAAFTASAAGSQHAFYGAADRAELDLDQASTGATIATVIANAGTAQSISALSAAAANSVSVASEGSTATVKAVQLHEGYVRGDAYVKSAEFGDANVQTIAVANTISADLYGPELTLDSDQVNSGGVEAEAAVFGGLGQQVNLSASAIGNAVHASACTECDGALTGTNRQVNNGDVSATSRTEFGGAARGVTGTTSAVGNSASYIVNRPR